MNEHNTQNSIETVWERSELQKPRCRFGEEGLCCQMCFMGPCRINPSGKKFQKGVCGASAEIIVARNFARMIAGGAAAHSDHGRHVAKTLLIAATSPDSGYSIKDVNKLKKVARVMGVPVKDRSKEEIALEVEYRRAIEGIYIFYLYDILFDRDYVTIAYGDKIRPDRGMSCKDSGQRIIPITSRMNLQNSPSLRRIIPVEPIYNGHVRVFFKPQ